MGLREKITDRESKLARDAGLMPNQNGWMFRTPRAIDCDEIGYNNRLEFITCWLLQYTPYEIAYCLPVLHFVQSEFTVRTLKPSLPRRHSFGSSRNLPSPFVGEERLRDEPKECLRGRLTQTVNTPHFLSILLVTIADRMRSVFSIFALKSLRLMITYEDPSSYGHQKKCLKKWQVFTVRLPSL